MAYKIVSSEVAANTTPSQFANNRQIRLISTAAAARTVTVYDNAIPLQLTINASANQTTLLTLTTNTGTTQGVTANMRILGSSNVQVVNTAVASQVTSVPDATTIVTNVDIIIANGTCQVYATGTKTFSILPNTSIVIDKGRYDFLQSNNDTEILAVAVNERGS